MIHLVPVWVRDVEWYFEAALDLARLQRLRAEFLRRLIHHCSQVPRLLLALPQQVKQLLVDNVGL